MLSTCHTLYRSLQNVEGQHCHTRPRLNPYPDPKLNPKAITLFLTLSLITIWCDPVDPVSLYVLQRPHCIGTMNDTGICKTVFSVCGLGSGLGLR